MALEWGRRTVTFQHVIRDSKTENLTAEDRADFGVMLNPTFKVEENAYVQWECGLLSKDQLDFQMTLILNILGSSVARAWRTERSKEFYPQLAEYLDSAIGQSRSFLDFEIYQIDGNVPKKRSGRRLGWFDTRPQFQALWDLGPHLGWVRLAGFRVTTTLGGQSDYRRGEDQSIGQLLGRLLNSRFSTSIGISRLCWLEPTLRHCIESVALDDRKEPQRRTSRLLRTSLPVGDKVLRHVEIARKDRL